MRLLLKGRIKTTPQKKVNPSFAKHYVLLVVGGVVFGTMGLDLDSCIERVCFLVVKLFTFSLCASHLRSSISVSSISLL